MARRTSRTDTQRVSIQPPSLTFKPRHPEQLEALQACHRHTVTFLTGVAGTAKTYCSVWYAISQAVQGEFEKILITRPAVTSGAEIGFLPGSADEKMKPLLQPLFDARDKIGTDKLSTIRALFETMPLCYARGRTIERSILIVDEAQNLTPDDIMTIVTRVGEGGKIIFCGDTMQNDLYGGVSVLDQAAAALAGASVGGYSVGHFAFSEDAIVRHPLTREMIRRVSEAGWYKDRFKRR